MRRFARSPTPRHPTTKLAVPAVLASGPVGKKYEGGINDPTVLAEFNSLLLMTVPATKPHWLLGQSAEGDLRLTLSQCHTLIRLRIKATLD